MIMLAAQQDAQTALKDRIAPLLPQIAAQARATEKAGRVPSRSIQELRACGYFDIVRPRAFGGSAGHFADLVDANIELASACASTGWVAGLLAAHQWLLAMFPKSAQQDVWESNADALLCGSYAPTQSPTAIVSTGAGPSQAVATMRIGRCARPCCLPPMDDRRRQHSCSCRRATTAPTMTGMWWGLLGPDRRHCCSITSSCRPVVC